MYDNILITDMKFTKKQFDIPKVEAKKTGHSKIKLVLSSLLAALILTVVFTAAYGVYTFFTTYGFQTPVILRSPIYRLNPEVIISPLASPSAMIRSAEFNVGAIADKIYTLESSNGKNDGCRDLGLYNGYGYRQNSFEWVCYKSHDEVRQRVITWLTKNIKEGNIEKALCLYNRGLNETGCRYAINYKSL